jgi:hypothetical protein
MVCPCGYEPDDSCKPEPCGEHNFEELNYEDIKSYCLDYTCGTNDFNTIKDDSLKEEIMNDPDILQKKPGFVTSENLNNLIGNLLAGAGVIFIAIFLMMILSLRSFTAQAAGRRTAITKTTRRIRPMISARRISCVSTGGTGEANSLMLLIGGCEAGGLILSPTGPTAASI